MSKRITIDKSRNILRLYDGGSVIREYPVATGRDPAQTPEGRFTIIRKVENPSWTNPDTGETIPGGTPQNPLGTRWLGISAGRRPGSSYGIHGTNNPASIGGHVSHGCVRMHNRDVEELYQLTPIGTQVTITP